MLLGKRCYAAAPLAVPFLITYQGSGSIHGNLLWYLYFLVCGGGARVLARRHGSWIGTKALR
jgi:hypothetical protein